MKNFIDIYNGINEQEILQKINNVERRHVINALSKETLSIDDFIALISPESDEFMDEMAMRSRHTTEKHFGKIMNLYVPLYLSNECTSGCAYCGFNKDKSIPRKTLNEDEIEIQLIELNKMGFKNVLLLTGDSRKYAGVDYISRTIKKARKLFPHVGLEVYPMDILEYSLLVNSGANMLTVYQETYNREKYKLVHLAGKKTDFIYRVETPERALQAGFRRIGLGVLLGLHNPVTESVYMALHAGFLMKKYWRSEVSISFPRLRKSEAGYIPDYDVTDFQLVKIILALRLFLPTVGIAISTRESSDFRDNMIDLGVTMMSAGSKTNPGGYTDNCSGKQFEIEDDRNVGDVLRAIKKRGYSPVFKDWDENFLSTKGGIFGINH